MRLCNYAMDIKFVMAINSISVLGPGVEVLKYFSRKVLPLQSECAKPAIDSLVVRLVAVALLLLDVKSSIASQQAERMGLTICRTEFVRMRSKNFPLCG